MTFYELPRPGERRLGFFESLSTRFTSGVRTMQYARMLEALNSLTDAQLAQINLARKDIPAHAHRCIYDQ